MPRMKLRPCPFCGEKIKDEFPNVSKLAKDDWCISHYCTTLRRPCGAHGVSVDVYGISKKQAVEMWNTRAATK